MERRSKRKIEKEESDDDGEEITPQTKKVKGSKGKEAKSEPVEDRKDVNDGQAILPKETIARIDAAIAIAPRNDDPTSFAFDIYLTESDKFYLMKIVGSGVSIRYGKIGSTGSAVNMRQLRSAYGAMTEVKVKVQDKLRKGYRETNQPAAEPVYRPLEQLKLVKALHPGTEHYNDHLFHITLTSTFQVESKFYVNRNYCTTSNRSFKTEDAARKFLMKKVEEYRAQGYEDY
jgi:predicted DNA-binding WGR domain protein